MDPTTNNNDQNVPNQEPQFAQPVVPEGDSVQPQRDCEQQACEQQSAAFDGANAQPQQTYGAQPYQAQPYQMPPYNANVAYPYGQPQQPYYGNPGQQYAGTQGYTQVPYGYPEQFQQPQQKKRKVWPWILGGCLGLVLLAVLGTAGCVACTAVTATVLSDSGSEYPDYDYGYDDGYGYDYDGDSSGSSPYGYSNSENLTREDIESAFADESFQNEASDNVFTSGIYEVGKDIQPGVYFLDGGTSIESNFYTFDADDNGTYELDASVSYFGNYFVQVESGDLLVFIPNDDSFKGRPQASADFKPEAPYDCGLYRVGKDIPAGTYTITVSDSAAKVAPMDCGAYVMKDLEWDDDSITDEVYVMKGGTQTITVKDGDWLELYAVVATPAE